MEPEVVLFVYTEDCPKWKVPGFGKLNEKGIMDLSTNQEVMGVKGRFENHVFKLNKFDETDVTGNNNLYNSRKTDNDNDSGSLFKDGYSSENLQVDPSLFSYSSFKKAMDLRTHSRTDDENRRTIFDDADYFAKNFFYKLLPITFEQVDETIIQTEHNYSLFSLNSESEAEEDCSRTMDYSQIKEKNYKRRRTKLKEGSDDEWDGNKAVVDSNQNIPNQKEPPVPEVDLENAIQPLDLSLAPPVQEQKTDHQHLHLKEYPVIPEESLSPKLKSIRVTITRPDEKENYQPCDMFLNDIARLVPRLINNDCFEIDILDRTGDQNDDLQKHRLYYIIAESTWRLFQSTRERVILTNDHTLGPPLKKIETDERPTFLVFDQFSLAKCLAEYCEEIGGCFQYTCVEEGKENEKEENIRNAKMIEFVSKLNNDDLLKVDAEETETIQIGTENTRTDEMDRKPQSLRAEELTTATKIRKLDGEDVAEPKKIENKTLGERTEYDLTETKTGKFVEEGLKAGQEHAIKTKRINVETNKTSTVVKEIKANADILVNFRSKEGKTNKRQIKQRKKPGKNMKKRKKNVIFEGSINGNKISGGNVKTLEISKTETAVFKDEKRIIAVNANHQKRDYRNTKDAKDEMMEKIKIKTDKEDIKICEPLKTTEEISNETNPEEKGTKELQEENTVKTTEVGSIERSAEMKERKTNKKSKRLRNTIETKAKQSKACAMDVEEMKIDKNAKEIKRKKAKDDSKKELEKKDIDEKGKREPKVNTRGAIRPKNINKSTEEAKKLEKLEVKRKGKRLETKRFNRSTLKKVKTKNNPAVPVFQIKTRKKSTSESETSHKPNTKIQKSKNRLENPPKDIKTIKESIERRTRSGKVIEEKKTDTKMKENGNEMRGRKRKVEDEGVVEKRCLRSRKGKEVRVVNLKKR